MSDDWKNNPRLSGMDPQKLSMLQGLADQGLGKNPSELLPFIMGAASKGKNAGLNFSSDEISTIIEVLKMGKSPAEAAKLDRIVINSFVIPEQRFSVPGFSTLYFFLYLSEYNLQKSDISIDSIA